MGISSHNSSADTALRTARWNAAINSKGLSSDIIYSAIKQAIRSSGVKGTVLDFGAGIGTFVKWLLSAGMFEAVHGADILTAPAELVGNVTWLEVDLNCNLPAPSNYYDLVVAAEVIEHLENPRFVCREIYRVLRPGALAIITTPNNEHLRSFLSLVVRGHFAAFTGNNYPAHITALLRSDLARILAEAGFDSTNFKHFGSGNIPLTRVTWGQISFGALRGRLFSDNIIVTARKPALLSSHKQL